jgi:hypothetical protein
MFHKVLLFLVFAILAAPSFAVDLPNRRIFIEGTATTPEQLEFFLINFNREAIGTGYPLAENRRDAGYIFRFSVEPNPNLHIDNNQYVIRISFINNSNNLEVLTLDFFFSELHETFAFNQLLFLRAVSIIPPLTESDIVIVQNAEPVIVTVTETVNVPVVDHSWRDKWWYLRTTFDYPITFYALQPNGLFGGIAVYDGPIEDPEIFSTEDHKILPMPGVTIGLEFQFFRFMSLEANIHASLGDTRNNDFINIWAGAELKIPLKFLNNFVIAPYGTFLIPLVVSDIFAEFPPYAFGGGIQIGTRGGRNGVFVVDIKYMLSLQDAVMHNPYGELYPNPPVIHYKRSVLGIGIGYKFGFGNRSRTTSAVEPGTDGSQVFYF